MGYLIMREPCAVPKVVEFVVATDVLRETVEERIAAEARFQERTRSAKT